MPIPSDYKELSSPEIDTRRVEALWSFRSSSAGEHLVLPDGRMDLIARYRVRSDGLIHKLKLVIVGPSQRPIWVAVAAGDQFLGIRFRAGWGGASLNIDPGALRDQSLTDKSVDTVLGSATAGLRAARTDIDLRAALLAASRPLTGASTRCKIAPEVIAAIDLLHLTGGRLTLQDVVRASGMSERTLRRRVAESVGLSIKALSAVLRFQRTARLLADTDNTFITLAHAALEGGYSDQAHMPPSSDAMAGSRRAAVPRSPSATCRFPVWPNSSRVRMRKRPSFPAIRSRRKHDETGLHDHVRPRRS
jgi:AraC-like DNA-binding protein